MGTNVATGIETVKLWKIDYTGVLQTGASITASYVAGKLHKTVVKDENWISGKRGIVEEFKDANGRVVLKRIWESDMKALNTYYIYDSFGDICYVVPPLVTQNTFTEETSDPVFEKYIYAYHYDSRRRVIEKEVPGKG